MRFHHSTRRGRTGRHAHQPQGRLGHARPLAARWAQLAYCRQTNIHFNRRVPVAPPEGAQPAAPPPGQHQAGEPVAGARAPANGRAANGRVAERDAQQVGARLRALHLARPAAKTAAPGDPTRAAKPANKRQPQKHQPPHQDGPAPAGPMGAGQQHQRQCPHVGLDMDTVREKLVAQVEKHPFWSTKAARKMRLLGVDQRRVFIYELVSYCQRRDLEWRYEPYRGGLVAGCTPFRGLADTPVAGAGLVACSLSQPASPAGLAASLLAASPRHQRLAAAGQCASDESAPTCGATSPIRRICSSAASSVGRQQARSVHESQPAPANGEQPPMGAQPNETPTSELVWSIEPPVQLRPAPFAGYAHSAEVPQSSFVKRCHGCQGRGRLKCASCHGVGYEVCISCSGKGTTKGLSAFGGRSSLANAPPARHSSSAGYYSARDHSASASYGSVWGGDQGGSAAGRLGGRHEEPGGVTQPSGSGAAWVSESCHFCHGAGQKRCWICAGRAYTSCLACAGTGQLRCYLNLNITWINHRDEFILNNADAIIPKERLKLSTGLVLADESADRLRPIGLLAGEQELQLGAPDGATAPPDVGPPASARPAGVCPSHEEANQLRLISSRLLDKHLHSYNQERLLRQRQRVTQIECFVVNWEWKRRRGHFVIYGDERKVYIAKYPFKSICNIT